MSEKLRTSFESMLKAKPKPAGPSAEPVHRGWLDGRADAMPVVYRPAGSEVDLAGWAQSSRDRLEEDLDRQGAVLFRGFRLDDPLNDFERLVAALATDLLDYEERSTPRSAVRGKLLTSTEYPADQLIPLHNELSYARRWPQKIWFFCVQNARQGGETPIADSQSVYSAIPPEIRETFARKKVMYVRNYRDDLGLPWQEVFQTGDKARVEAFCRENGLELEWRGDGGLRTRAVRHAVARHPRTGGMLWFNQAHLHHTSSLAPEIRETLLREMGEEDLPFQTFYGDGTPIAEGELDAVRTAFDETQVVFPWQEGDVLMLDNMRVAHGRRPYAGPRRIVVAMADATGDTGLE